AAINQDDDATETLIGHDDWSHLRFSFLESAYFATGATDESPIKEMTINEFDELNAVGPSSGVLEFRMNAQEVSENAGAATITVTRAGGAQGSVTVHFATAAGTATAGSDYEAVSGVLTFADGELSQTFTVAVQNDSLGERTES